MIKSLTAKIAKAGAGMNLPHKWRTVIRGSIVYWNEQFCQRCGATRVRLDSSAKWRAPSHACKELRQERPESQQGVHDEDSR